jgi:hypothetical protein
MGRNTLAYLSYIIGDAEESFIILLPLACNIKLFTAVNIIAIIIMVVKSFTLQANGCSFMKPSSVSPTSRVS